MPITSPARFSSLSRRLMLGSLAVLIAWPCPSAWSTSSASTKSRSVAYMSSPPKTISVRSNSSRTASRPDSTTKWSTRCGNTRRSRSSRKSCPGPASWPASAPASTTSRSPLRSSPRSARSRSTSPARSRTRPTTTSSARTTRRIASIKDLSGKTVGVQAGSALLGRLPELDAMLKKDGGKLGKVVEYTSYPEAYQDLALGRTDYVVNTVINLKTLVAEKPRRFRTWSGGLRTVVSGVGRCEGQHRIAGVPERIHRQGEGQRPMCRIAEEVVR